ncbi:hypothetical protein TRFO_15308 [Tritrichomonas foetus]|uniref:Uncharacterized protein n=1 Tax=Tritrichomonas foetus TaxID=1144522 RepID=A0A1J4KTZ0_9EUKA|nr:hypothetical protein TRFO_15308 [Tritrichomonas foetus]|eukprot:OHT14376.1 hypothetical protein TRFO_15308 [Tritrichomonas foetus]
MCILHSTYFKKIWYIFCSIIWNINHFLMTKIDSMMTSDTQETLNNTKSRIISQLTLYLAIYLGSAVLSFFPLIFKNPKAQGFSLLALTVTLITSLLAPFFIVYVIIQHIFEQAKEIIEKPYFLQDIIFHLITNLFHLIISPIFDIYYLLYYKRHIICDFFWGNLSKICTLFVRRIIWLILRFLVLIFAVTDWIHYQILDPLYFLISKTLGKIFHLSSQQNVYLIVLEYKQLLKRIFFNTIFSM